MYDLSIALTLSMNFRKITGKRTILEGLATCFPKQEHHTLGCKRATTWEISVPGEDCDPPRVLWGKECQGSNLDPGAFQGPGLIQVWLCRQQSVTKFLSRHRAIWLSSESCEAWGCRGSIKMPVGACYSVPFNVCRGKKCWPAHPPRGSQEKEIRPALVHSLFSHLSEDKQVV